MPKGPQREFAILPVVSKPAVKTRIIVTGGNQARNSAHGSIVITAASIRNGTDELWYIIPHQVTQTDPERWLLLTLLGLSAVPFRGQTITG